MTGGIWAAVPVKEFGGAKDRLSALFDPAQRRALAAAMLEDVLEALAAAPLAGVLLNTLEPAAIELAARYGARVVALEARSGHTGAVSAMARFLAAEGAAGMLTCPLDIPAVTSAEIARVLTAHLGAHSLTIVPAHDDMGSNTILVSPPDAMRFRFGEDSFFPHLAVARSLGLSPVVVRATGIGLDIDTPEDARRFLAAPESRGTRARALLEGWV